MSLPSIYLGLTSQSRNLSLEHPLFDSKPKGPALNPTFLPMVTINPAQRDVTR